MKSMPQLSRFMPIQIGSLIGQKVGQKKRLQIPICQLQISFLLSFMMILFGTQTLLGVTIPQDSWWGPAIDQQLESAGDNGASLKAALTDADPAHQPALKFLVTHMSPFDLRNRKADELLKDVGLALRIQRQAKWKIPEEIFLNNILPFANVDEQRDPWRDELHKICQPLVTDCDSTSAAAQRLNEKLFQIVKVKYSTKRKRANQSPAESMESGLASCTGLSILLIDACRSVGVPARLVGIPSWPNKRGNHTWVEIWDNGTWHFTGAAEPSSQGLNHTWFQRDAALADKTKRLNSIYAVSFRRTDTQFPLVWSRNRDHRIYAENVTDRYTPAKTSTGNRIRLLVRVWNHNKSERKVCGVSIWKQNEPDKILKGQSKAGTADMNDMLSFDLDQNAEYQVMVHSNGSTLSETTLRTGNGTQKILEIVCPKQESISEELEKQINTFFEKESESPVKAFSDKTNQWFAQNQKQLVTQVWEMYQKSPQALSMQADFDQNQVRFREHLSPYVVREVGERPKEGWPLFIAMHGGGGAPAQVNDSQWRIMQRYYRDQPDLGGYKYLALRAPNNTWNGFYDDYVYPLIENLIRQFIVLGDVDPNKVFLMGYSHGGYGAFAIGPKIPYRFAAVHSSAAAPTDGQTSAQTLRNTRFTFMVGEHDSAYGRRKRCEAFAKQIEELKAKNADAYPVEFLYQPGFGHGGLPDRDMIREMYRHNRNAVPKHLTWEQNRRGRRPILLVGRQPTRSRTMD